MFTFKPNIKKGLVAILLLVSVIGVNLGAPLAMQVNQSTTVMQKSQTVSMVDAFIPAAYAAQHEEEADPTRAQVDTDTITEIVSNVQKGIVWVNGILTPLIYFFTFQLGNFLDNSYIYSGPMGDMLQSIWVASRNIVNIVFVLVLLYLAIMHIFRGESEGSTDLKKILPKFAIFLIAVNFTWLGTKVVMDAANVATNVVFAIPSGVQTTLDNFDAECNIDSDNKVSGLCSPTKFYYPDDAKRTVSYPMEECPDINALKTQNEQSRQLGEPVTSVICWEQMDLTKYDINTASMYLNFNMGRVQNLPHVNIPQGAEFEPEEGLLKVSIGFIFSMILQFVYLVAFLVLIIVLIIRFAVLWLLIAFSPFLVLAWFLTKDVQVPGLDAGEFSFQSFFKWAFVPVKVAAVFSVGFLMVTAGQITGESVLQGTLGGSGEYINTNTLFATMDNLQEFIWLIVTVGIMWVGTFAAVSKLPIAGSITNAITGYVKGVSQLAAKSPLWAPVVPITDSQGNVVGKQSIVGTFDIKRKLETAARGAYGVDKDQITKVDQVVKQIDDQNLHNQVLRNIDKPQELRNYFTKMGIAQGTLSNQSGINAIVDAIRNSKNEDFSSQADRIGTALTRAMEKTPPGTKKPDESVTEHQEQEKVQAARTSADADKRTAQAAEKLANEGGKNESGGESKEGSK